MHEIPRKPGRPSSHAARVPLSLRISPELQQALTVVADSENLSVNEFVIRVLSGDPRIKKFLEKGDETMTIYPVAKKFVESPDFKEGVIQSTKAGFGGSYYAVELFEDGTWRVLWGANIGNKYDHPTSMIVHLPIIELESDDDINDAFDCQEAELKQEFLANIAQD